MTTCKDCEHIKFKEKLIEENKIQKLAFCKYFKKRLYCLDRCECFDGGFTGYFILCNVLAVAALTSAVWSFFFLREAVGVMIILGMVMGEV